MAPLSRTVSFCRSIDYIRPLNSLIELRIVLGLGLSLMSTAVDRIVLKWWSKLLELLLTGLLLKVGLGSIDKLEFASVGL